MPDRHPDHGLLRELEPVAERLLDRHLSMAKELVHAMLGLILAVARPMTSASSR